MQKPKATKIINELTDKLQEIPKIPAILKNRTDFPMHEQSISNSGIEAITQEMMQNIIQDLSIHTQFIGLLPSQK